MKRISAFVFCFMMSVPLCAAVTLKDLRDAIEGGDTEKFKTLVEDVLKEDPSGKLLQSKFPYTVGWTLYRNLAGEKILRPVILPNCTLLMLAVMRIQKDIVSDMVTTYAHMINKDDESNVTTTYNVSLLRLSPLTALRLAKLILSGTIWFKQGVALNAKQNSDLTKIVRLLL